MSPGFTDFCSLVSRRSHHQRFDLVVPESEGVFETHSHTDLNGVDCESIVLKSNGFVLPTKAFYHVIIKVNECFSSYCNALCGGFIVFSNVHSFIYNLLLIQYLTSICPIHALKFLSTPHAMSSVQSIETYLCAYM